MSRIRTALTYGGLVAAGYVAGNMAPLKPIEDFPSKVASIFRSSGQEAVAQAQPAVQYADKVVTAGKGYTTLGTVLSHYFRASNLDDLTRKTERYNGLQPNARLQKDQEIRILIDHGNRREAVVYRAKRNGDRVYNVVNRAVVDQNNLGLAC